MMEHLSHMLSRYARHLATEQAIALAVSGGPDSMALAHLMLRWAEAQTDGIEIHILCVDHGLRAESAAEAAFVAEAFAARPGCRVEILRWDHDGVEARVQEQARAARYALMKAYCAAQNISVLCTAHHKDDQAETILFRLAKGSGIDGLAGMASLQDLGAGVTLLRPFLDVDKEALAAYCAANNIAFKQDPSNVNEVFARPRLRAAREVLAAEGLTAGRLVTLGQRAAHAREALDAFTQMSWRSAVCEEDTKRIVLNCDPFCDAPFEIAVRLILFAMDRLAPFSDYAPRRERVERLVTALRSDQAFRRQTLGGVIFSRADGPGHVILEVENAALSGT